MAVTSIGQTSSRAAVVRYRPSIEAAGLLTLLLGAWGGIVAYIGPSFGFSADGSATWTWNLAHGLLFLVPGAGACIAGLLVMFEGLSTGPARRSLLTGGALLAGVCGAWFIVGSVAWPVLEGVAFFKSASPLLELAYWVGYALGTGGLLLALGAFALGRPHRSLANRDES